MNESEKPFTVKDRRHFTADGEVREESETPAEAEAEAPEPDRPAAEETTPPSEPPSSPPPPAEERPGPPPGAEDIGKVDLSQFVLSLGAQAGMLLTGQGLPEGADPAEALVGARSMISILEMLQEKTEGNRTDEETQVLEGLLYELRMAYVEKSRGGGS